MKVDLNEKVALITGSTRGIGKAIALAFAENGADIILNSNEPSDADAAAAEVKKRGGKALFLQADAGDNQQVTQTLYWGVRMVQLFFRVNIEVCSRTLEWAITRLGDPV